MGVVANKTEGGNATAANVTTRATLENVGKIEARQVVQLYVAYPKAPKEPPKLLRAIQKYALAPGEITTVELAVSGEDLRIWESGSKTLKLIEGEYVFMLGFSSTDIKAKQPILI